MSTVRDILAKIDAEPNEDIRETLTRELDKAVNFGVTASALSSLLNAAPVILYTRRNEVTGIVELIHPSSPEPIFEDARDVLARMSAECDMAARLASEVTLN